MNLRIARHLPLNQTRRFFTTTRTMASKQEWLIILPDYPDALERRLAVRPTHLENVKPDVAAGRMVFGGATLDEPAKEGQPLALNGSVMMVVADTKEQALERVRSDVYWEHNVWDKSKVQIMPFKSAVREQL